MMTASPELPELTGQIRVLVIEDDFALAQPILSRCTEAGMDARYAPMGRSGLEAVRDTHPHVIILSDVEGNDIALKVGLYSRKISAAPILILTHGHSNNALWRAVSTEASNFLDSHASAQAVLERAALLVKNAYHAKQLMISETPDDTPQNLPHNWGKCQSCGYLGPRSKFEVGNPLARHRHVCPVCKNFSDIVFSV